MKLPFILFAIFALIAVIGGAIVPVARHEETEAIGLALLVAGFLGATVLPFLTFLVRRESRK